MKDAENIAQALRKLSLFAGTDEKTLEDWLNGLSCAPSAYRNGDMIEGDARRLGILLSGKAKIHSADCGRNVILRELTAPGIFGAAALFCEGTLPLSRIEASSACRVLLLDAAAVRALMNADAGFRDAYLAFLAGRVRFLNHKILCFTAGSAERKLALWLTSENDSTILLPASLTALSDMLNIGRASLYRALDKLENDGLIHRDGRTITVISQDELLKKYQ